MQKLMLMSLGGNDFTEIPARISSLRSLRHLRLSNLNKITSLGRDIVDLPNMEIIDCDGCQSLQTPPLAVCKKGIQAIRSYYNNLADGIANEPPVLAGAVIGNKMAGKTSLILSLKNNRRELTYRNEQDLNDDATRAFKVNEVAVGDKRLSLFDFGGDKVYHITYQMAIRANYIPIVVINMKQYADLTASSTANQAARQLCMDYLSHLYLACPKLGSPILVLTHKDCFGDFHFDCKKNELLKEVENIRREMKEEEEAVYLQGGNENRLSNIEHLRNTGKNIFHPKDIVAFGKDLSDMDGINYLKARIENRCDGGDKIPKLWKKIAKFIDEHSDDSHITFAEISAEFPGEDLLHVLHYMHDTGRILWFENDVNLSNFIFHRLSVITDMITTLFNHQSRSLWQKRLEEFQPFVFRSRLITKHEFVSMVDKFHATGNLDEAIICVLLEKHELPVDVAVNILTSFSIVCGPIIKPAGGAYFILPYFSERAIEIDTRGSQLIPLRTCVQFVGLPPPSYVYNVMTATFLNAFTDHGFHITTGANGAVVKHGTYISRIFHDNKHHRLSIQTEWPIKELDYGWRYLFQLLEYIIGHLISVWEAAHPVVGFTCAHCLHLGVTDPYVKMNPDWYTLPTQQRPTLGERLQKFEGISYVDCPNDQRNYGPLNVPKPLQFPCEYPTVS